MQGQQQVFLHSPRLLCRYSDGLRGYSQWSLIGVNRVLERAFSWITVLSILDSGRVRSDWIHLIPFYPYSREPNPNIVRSSTNRRRCMDLELDEASSKSQESADSCEVALIRHGAISPPSSGSRLLKRQKNKLNVDAANSPFCHVLTDQLSHTMPLSQNNTLNMQNT